MLIMGNFVIYYTINLSLNCDTKSSTANSQKPIWCPSDTIKFDMADTVKKIVKFYKKYQLKLRN